MWKEVGLYELRFAPALGRKPKTLWLTWMNSCINHIAIASSWGRKVYQVFWGRRQNKVIGWFEFKWQATYRLVNEGRKNKKHFFCLPFPRVLTPSGGLNHFYPRTSFVNDIAVKI